VHTHEPCRQHVACARDGPSRHASAVCVSGDKQRAHLSAQTSALPLSCALTRALRAHASRALWSLYTHDHTRVTPQEERTSASLRRGASGSIGIPIVLRRNTQLAGSAAHNNVFRAGVVRVPSHGCACGSWMAQSTNEAMHAISDMLPGLQRGRRHARPALACRRSRRVCATCRIFALRASMPSELISASMRASRRVRSACMLPDSVVA
jgi:hypothetical protein